MRITIAAWDNTGNIVHGSELHEVEVGDTGKFSLAMLDLAARKAVREAIERRRAWRADQIRKRKEAK